MNALARCKSTGLEIVRSLVQASSDTLIGVLHCLVLVHPRKVSKHYLKYFDWGGGVKHQLKQLFLDISTNSQKIGQAFLSKNLSTDHFLHL